jgi:hypothetical protein
MCLSRSVLRTATNAGSAFGISILRRVIPSSAAFSCAYV